MTIVIYKMEEKYFPRWCCGKEFKNARTFMDHFLPAHMRAKS